MGQRTVKAGTSIFFGAPAAPMPQSLSDSIREVVAQVPGIAEAHLPQCFVEGDSEARQVLVVAVDAQSQIPRVVEELMGGLKLIFPAGQWVDILPFKVGALPPGIRQAGCQIFAVAKKPWWKVW